MDAAPPIARDASHREAFLLKMLDILHHGLVDARMMAYRVGDQPLIDLTDLLEVLPTLIGRPGEEQERFIQAILDDYRKTHGGRNYAAMLSRPDAEFMNEYVPPAPVDPRVFEDPAPPAARAA